LQSQSPLVIQAISQIETKHRHHTDQVSPRSRLHPITVLAYWLKQMWLHPVIDYSLPPDQVYQTIPAWQLLDKTTAASLSLDNQIVILAPGGYGEAGIALGQDNFDLPAAVRHWRFWQADASTSLTNLTGGEIHAYMLHHLLTRHLIVPLPDLWMIGIAAIVGQATVLLLRRQPITRRAGYLWLLGATAAYGIASLQLYVSATLLIPWLLPSLTFWLYAWPVVHRLETNPKHTWPRGSGSSM
jgi:hypothetical protein